MKKLLVLAIILSVSLLFLSGCGEEPLSGSALISTQQSGIWVTGTGKVTVTPDIATIQLGIEAQQASVAQAQSQAAKAMDDVITALKAQGIAESDIQTQRFSITQVTRFDEESQEQVVVGYRVTNIVRAKVRELDKLGSIIDSVAEAGGDLTRINGISFSVEDPSMYYDEIRTEAMEDAKNKAQQVASLAGVSVGKPTYISEGAQSPPVRLPIEVGVTAPSPTTPVSPGEIEITLTVQVAYQIID
jgi:uncharacterized protein YggE